MDTETLITALDEIAADAERASASYYYDASDYGDSGVNSQAIIEDAVQELAQRLAQKLRAATAPAPAPAPEA